MTLANHVYFGDLILEKLKNSFRLFMFKWRHAKHCCTFEEIVRVTRTDAINQSNIFSTSHVPKLKLNEWNYWTTSDYCCGLRPNQTVWHSTLIKVWYQSKNKHVPFLFRLRFKKNFFFSKLSISLAVITRRLNTQHTLHLDFLFSGFCVWHCMLLGMLVWVKTQRYGINTGIGLKLEKL